MLDPITTSLAAIAGKGMIDRLLNSVGSLGAASSNNSRATDAITEDPTTELTDAKSVPNSKTFEEILSAGGNRQKAFQKFFEAHPKLKQALGEGPYSVTTNPDGTLTLSSTSTGHFVTLDPASSLGQQAKALLQPQNIAGKVIENIYKAGSADNTYKPFSSSQEILAKAIDEIKNMPAELAEKA